MRKTISSLLISLMFLLAAYWVAAAAVTRDDVLREGLRSNEAFSMALAQKAAEAPKDQRVEMIQTAISISPDLPALYFKLASSRLPDIFGSMGAVVDGLKAYSRNYWWLMSFAGLAYISLIYSFLLSLSVLIVIRLFLDIPLLVHDVNESKSKFLLVMIALGTCVAGPVGFLAGGIFLTGLYMKKTSKPLVYIALIALALAPVLMGVSDMYYSVPAPEQRAVTLVNQRQDNRFALDILEGREDPLARFSYALALKRTGQAIGAINIFGQLSQGDFDYRADVNLANAYVAAGRSDYAKQAYEAALQKKPTQAIALYNLSQVYRDELNYKVGDEYYNKAQAADRDLVTSFTPLQGKHFNRLVVDETLTMGELIGYAIKQRSELVTAGMLPRIILSAVAVAMLLLFSMVDKGMKYRSYRCKQCGKIACIRCAGEGVRGKLCIDCFGGQGKEDESPRARVARMLRANEMKNRLMDRIRMLSFAPPGISQTYSRRTLSGFFFLWFFSFAVLLIALNPHFEAGLYGSSHWWVWFPAGIFIIIIYTISIMTTVRRLDRGWL